MVKQILQEAVQSHKFPLLFATISGAHLYGFPSPNSDYDLRGVHVLPLEEVVGMHVYDETIESMDDKNGIELDLVTHDVHKFFRLLLKKNGYVLEQLFSPLIVHTTTHHRMLKEIASSCITRYHSHHYLGFANTQWRLFEKEDPPRVKPLLYVYRVLLTGLHLMRTGLIEANLVTLNEEFSLPYLPELIESKRTGSEEQVLTAVDVKFHRAEFDRLVEELKLASERSSLREATTAQPELDALLKDIRINGIKP